MKKVIFLLLLFGLLPCLIWAQEYNIKPGVTLTKDNYEKYLPQLEKLIFPAHLHYVIKGLKNGWITVPIVEKREYHTLNGFVKATLGNAGKYKVGKDNKLIGPPWRGGLPFPDPKTGAELGWNAYKRQQAEHESFLRGRFSLRDKEDKLEREFSWYVMGKYWNGRTDIPPIPEIPGNNGEIYVKFAILITKPFDARGFSYIRIIYEDIYKTDDVFSYIPAIRRVRRMTGSDVTDPVLGSDCIYDDFDSWQQKIQTKMSFNMLGKKEFLVPRYISETSFDSLEKSNALFRNNCFQVEWEKRPLWVLEILTNDPDYVYNRRVFYTEVGGTCRILGEENYDQKGRLWRTFSHVSEYDPVKFFKGVRAGRYDNRISRHSSANSHWRIYPFGTPSPEKLFTISGLLKKAK
jgi:hypothetical protein